MPQRQKERKPGRFREKAKHMLELGKRMAKRMRLTKDRREELDEALLKAAEEGNDAEITRLLKAGASVNAAPDDDTALMEAARHGKAETCALLLKEGAFVNAADNIGNTALIWAAMNGHAGVCAILLGNGADANARNSFGFFALTYAMNYGHRTAAAFLKHPVPLLKLISVEQLQPFINDFEECTSQ
jgi:ankyrin repeat protein